VACHRGKGSRAENAEALRESGREFDTISFFPFSANSANFARNFLSLRKDPSYDIRMTTNEITAAIIRHNAVVADRPPTREADDAFRSSINSYLGILGHGDSWRFRVGVLHGRL
jgi:hypothetical protein